MRYYHVEKTRARGKDRQEGKGRRESEGEGQRGEHTCIRTHAAQIVKDPKIIENGSPHSLLNQAAASSVCSVIAESADRVVLRQPNENRQE